jgi:hypothetical protein
VAIEGKRGKQACNNLPFITETPFWGSFFLDQDNSYYFVTDGKRRPIEFINDNWYHIVWSTQGKQFHIAKDGFIHKTACKHHQLLTWNSTDPFALENRKKSLETYYEQTDTPLPVETELEPIFFHPDNLEPTNNKGKGRAIEIAETLWSTPIFDDIAEPRDREQNQPRKHYLPTIMGE